MPRASAISTLKVTAFDWFLTAGVFFAGVGMFLAVVEAFIRYVL